MTEQLGLMDQTMQFTANGAYAMQDTAAETKRLAEAMQTSANAALGSVKASEEANKVLLRPYVYLADEKIDVSFVEISAGQRLERMASDIGEAKFSVKNFGQTPAKRVRLKARLFIGEYWVDGGAIDLEAATEIHRADLPPGFARDVQGYTVAGVAKAFAKILDGQRSIFFDGQIDYEDAGGKAYVTHFRRVATGHDITKGVFIITAEGNDAT